MLCEDMVKPNSNSRLPCGPVVLTDNAAKKLSIEDVAVALGRHFAGERGGVPAPDRNAKNHGRLRGFRSLSANRSRAGLRFWVITEAASSITTVLLDQDPPADQHNQPSSDDKG